MRALVLSGGGSAAAYHIGAIEALYGMGKRYDVIAGISAGALMAAFLAKYPVDQDEQGLRELKEMWLGLKTEDVLRKPRFWWLRWLWAKNLYSTAPLEGLINKFIDLDAIRSSGKSLAVSATCLTDGLLTTSTQADPDFLAYIRASASIPVLFPPVMIDGDWYCDGGVLSLTPVTHVMAMYPEVLEIDVIVCDGPVMDWRKKYPNVLSILGRTVELMRDEAYRNDFPDSFYGEEGTKITIYRASREPVRSILEFSPEESKKAYELGKQDVEDIYKYR